ncbi:hypothetical protein ACFVRD_40465 [Streptomyces sp. NPDC057908]|uniref:hypothetical protein n=1 Tax=Streptomyces sp. NPDC057908 TaxID=3346276 RepID=UPI0036EFFF30
MATRDGKHGDRRIVSLLSTIVAAVAAASAGVVICFVYGHHAGGKFLRRAYGPTVPVSDPSVSPLRALRATGRWLVPEWKRA